MGDRRKGQIDIGTTVQNCFFRKVDTNSVRVVLPWHAITDGGTCGELVADVKNVRSTSRGRWRR